MVSGKNRGDGLQDCAARVHLLRCAVEHFGLLCGWGGKGKKIRGQENEKRKKVWHENKFGLKWRSIPLLVVVVVLFLSVFFFSLLCYFFLLSRQFSHNPRSTYRIAQVF